MVSIRAASSVHFIQAKMTRRLTTRTGCVVLDNPPFSILSQICDFYLNRGIRFFLFAPSLTAFSGKSVAMRMNHIVCDADIIYENGACVKTAFVTSYGGDIVAQTAPDLGAKIAEAVKKIKAMTTATKPKYTYPDHIVTAAMLQRYSKYGVNFRVRRGDCVLIAALDDQRRAGKTIFGGGPPLSEKAAAGKAAAEGSGGKGSGGKGSGGKGSGGKGSGGKGSGGKGSGGKGSGGNVEAVATRKGDYCDPWSQGWQKQNDFKSRRPAGAGRRQPAVRHENGRWRLQPSVQIQHAGLRVHCWGAWGAL
ncbi:MAG: hypothetical protein V8T01_07105 [Oscillospiraceae bacterium]